MVFFTLYSAPQIKRFSNDDLNALVTYCASRICGQYGNLHFIEFSKKEIIAKAKAEFRDRGGLENKAMPADCPVDLRHFSPGMVNTYEWILERTLQEICASLKIPRVITLDDQT